MQKKNFESLKKVVYATNAKVMVVKI
jgi:hypothetical protein